MTDHPIAPEIFRKRLLVEGFYKADVNENMLRDYFKSITSELSLQTYGDPIIHKTSGQGKPENQGYDAFVPLVDSGIYIAVWTGQKFLSTILYTCADFNEKIALRRIKDFFDITEDHHKTF